MDLYGRASGQKAGIDSQLGLDVGEYRAKYGTTTEPTPTVADEGGRMTGAPSTAVPTASFVPAPKALAPSMSAATRAGTNADQQLGQTLFGEAGPWNSGDASVQQSIADAFSGANYRPPKPTLGKKKKR